MPEQNRLLRRNPMGISEEEIYNQADPIGDLKFNLLLRRANRTTEAQRKMIGQQNLNDLLYATPIIGNIMSARDVPHYLGQAAEATGKDPYATRLNTGLALLSGIGAATGLPFGRTVGQVARAAKDTAYAIPAWHGSSHDFDQFRLDKIGTGEGAQVYGHGLYFAENPEVAKTYQYMLGDYSNIVNWKSKTPPNENELKILEKFKVPDRTSGGPKTYVSVRQEISASNSPSKKSDLATLDNMKDKFEVADPGHLYRTELDVEPEDLLDWDKPLSQQSEKVKAAITKINPNFKDAPVEGASLYRFLGDDATATQALREAGIPGIKYLDQGSRGSGAGTSNYVIFDENLVKILGKE